MYKYLKKSFALILICEVLVTSNFSKAITVINKLNKPVGFRIVCIGKGGDTKPTIVKPGDSLSACTYEAEVHIGRDWYKEYPEIYRSLANADMQQESLFIKQGQAYFWGGTRPHDVGNLRGKEIYLLEKLDGSIRRKKPYDQYYH